ncbi:GNAT family N-acetyltransferase [Paenibacillus sp. N1-5-1-14]|uniref:GNAT family N-acetyltransferase n=1 Tax=Paenibacillus radicibacter TaxID=2972488 RepID=UPI002158EECC|nr:GNAT family N-acetyltransferase [Paenibacillus radicibacter]MCR8645662.1 GNAT family N-acetyltransferase [Paenibacillus radicibacter]
MQIIRVDQNGKDILKQLMTLFLHDLSEYNNDIEINQSTGVFEFDVFDWFFEKEGLTPFFIKNTDKIIGFILLQSGPFSNQEFADYVLNSFFILKKYRRQGLGKEACKVFFKQFPGRYAISQIETNIPAIQFWKNTYRSFGIEFYEKAEIEEGHKVIYQYFKV